MRLQLSCCEAWARTKIAAVTAAYDLRAVGPKQRVRGTLTESEQLMTRVLPRIVSVLELESPLHLRGQKKAGRVCSLRIRRETIEA
jgi:hypothetical protein